MANTLRPHARAAVVSARAQQRPTRSKRPSIPYVVEAADQIDPHWAADETLLERVLRSVCENHR